VAAAKAPTTYLVARTGFICEVRGVEHLIQQNQRVPADHPVAKKHPELFGPAEETR
jgi:hypothetical protein